MCNPRKVVVTAGRELAVAWEHEVRRVATRSAGATGEARVREELDASIGAPVLTMLERVLDGAEGWQRLDDSFRYELDGGYLEYHVDSRSIEIVARASDMVDVEVSTSTVMRGEISETIEASGIGRYYDDEWGGVTAADAQVAAERDAAANLEARRHEVLDAARNAAEAERARELEAAVGAQADAELAARTAEREAELRAEAARRLTAIGIQGRNVLHQALALAYRDAILAYARVRGAERLSVSEQGGVVDIEFELRA
jgi:hypothetical protein